MSTLNVQKDTKQHDRNDRHTGAAEKQHLNSADKHGHGDNSIADKFRATATSTFNKAGEFAEEAKAKAKQAFDELPKAIKEYPVQSMLVGVGVGLIAGIFLNKAMNSKTEYLH